jgi:hypothetical protein
MDANDGIEGMAESKTSCEKAYAPILSTEEIPEASESEAQFSKAWPPTDVRFEAAPMLASNEHPLNA